MSERMTDEQLYDGADAAGAAREAATGDYSMRMVGRAEFWRAEALRARREEAQQQDRIHALEVQQAELIRQGKGHAEIIERMTERERHFATVLRIPDGGRYGNDWDARLTGLITTTTEQAAEISRLTALVAERQHSIEALGESSEGTISALTEAVLYAERALEVGTLAARDLVTAKIAVLRVRGDLP